VSCMFFGTEVFRLDLKRLSGNRSDSCVTLTVVSWLFVSCRVSSHVFVVLFAGYCGLVAVSTSLLLAVFYGRPEIKQTWLVILRCSLIHTGGHFMQNLWTAALGLHNTLQRPATALTVRGDNTVSRPVFLVE